MNGDGSEPADVAPELAAALLRERFGPAPLAPPVVRREIVRFVDTEFDCARRRRDLLAAMGERRERVA